MASVSTRLASLQINTSRSPIYLHFCLERTRSLDAKGSRCLAIETGDARAEIGDDADLAD